MIYNRSNMRYSYSVSKLSDYLTLCKLDILVRNREDSRPHVRGDQPSKVGKPMTNTERANITQTPGYHIEVDFSTKIGNRNITLRLKNELSKQMRLSIISLTEAGIVILQQDNKDLCRMSLYSCIYQYADNFANSRTSQRKFCLVGNQQENWVNSLVSLISRERQQVDGIIIIYDGLIRYYPIPKSGRR